VSSATLNPALRSFWETKARNKVLKGGRASSKSWDAAGMAIYLATRYTLRFLCVRQIQNKISESVYSLLLIQIERFKLQAEFTVLKNSIVHNTTGSEFLFYGLWRNPDEIKSIESVDILWSEESHAMTKNQWDILEPTIRKEGSECWIIFNPNLATDFVYKRFVLNPPPNTAVRHINYDENPFLSSTMKKIIDAAKIEDEENFNHIYLGHPKEDNEESIIKRSWVEACIDAHIKLGIEPTGRKKLGFDIADDGNDTNVTVLIYGILAMYLKEWKAKEDELMESSRKAYDLALEHNAIIQYDCIGVGASAGSHFKTFNAQRGHNLDFFKFDAGGAILNPDRLYQPQVKNKDYFLNLKAQAWWTMADRMKETFNAVTKGMHYNPENIISISSNIQGLEALKEQLCTPRKTHNPQYKNKVESKEELKKRGINSPNLADAFIMAYAQTKNPPMQNIGMSVAI
jgi:phage terminase large subunit